MNAPEKKVLFLALFLLGTGWLVRLSPWNPIPSIESFSYSEEAPVVESWPQNDVKEGDSPRVLKTKKTSKKVQFPIAINRASSEELCALKGVGPKLADRIIAHRNTVGPFKSAADLRKVSGIGDKKSKTILPFIIFD